MLHEQPRPRGGRAARRPRRLRRHRPGGPVVGRVRRHRRARCATLGDDETMLVQSGKPVGVFRTHEWAPRVLIANSNLVPEWATWDEFRRLEAPRPHDVRADDGRLVDLHRHAGHPAGHLRVLRRDRPPPLRRHAGRHDHAHRRPRRHGRRPAAGRHDERRRRAVRRRRPEPHRAAAARPATSTRWPTRSTTPSPAATQAKARRAGAVGRAARPTPPTLLPALLELGLRRRHRHRPDQRPRPAELRARPTCRRRRPPSCAQTDPDELRPPGPRQRWRVHCAAMVGFLDAGAEVFDYGNSLRTEARLGGFDRAFDYPGFLPAYIRPLFCEGKGPFRWVALSGDPADIAATDAGRARGVPRRRRPGPLDPPGRRAGRVPGPAGPHLLARLRRAPPARAALQRDGALAARCRRRS